jgi:transaldolase/glucose-6-phosphate isomerase
LVVADVRQAADALRGVYEESGFEDGYVSLEVSPKVSHDSAATVREALELVAAVGRDNLMIKVPATAAGAVALSELIGQGISVNATLLFSGEQYRTIAEAYLLGLEKAAAAGVNLKKIASVASFFVSRVDGVVDAWLSSDSRANSPEAQKLMGKIAIANAQLAYSESLELFGSERFKVLEARGARQQRLLWASTGTKNPKYPDTIYVDGLIGPGTVNTVPPATLSAFQDHGAPQASLASNLEAGRQMIGQLLRLGFDLDGTCEGLQRDGLTSFTEAMDALFASIAKRRAEALK